MFNIVAKIKKINKCIENAQKRQKERLFCLSVRLFLGYFLYNNSNSTFLRFLMDGTTFPL